jgi:hypothetical protein
MDVANLCTILQRSPKPRCLLSNVVPLARPRLQLGCDRAERAAEARTDQYKGGDRRDGNQRRDQRIFHCRDAAAILDQPVNG